MLLCAQNRFQHPLQNSGEPLHSRGCCKPPALANFGDSMSRVPTLNSTHLYTSRSITPCTNAGIVCTVAGTIVLSLLIHAHMTNCNHAQTRPQRHQCVNCRTDQPNRQMRGRNCHALCPCGHQRPHHTDPILVRQPHTFVAACERASSTLTCWCFICQ